MSKQPRWYHSNANLMPLQKSVARAIMWWMAIHICHRSSQHESSHPPISTCPFYYLLSKQMHMYINQPLCVCMMHLLQWTTTSVHHVFYKKCGISKQRRCVLYSWQKNHNCLGPVLIPLMGNTISDQDMTCLSHLWQRTHCQESNVWPTYIKWLQA